MPKITARTQVEITLTLTEDEAQYLRALLQNYLGGKLCDEPDDHREIRQDLHDALRLALSR